MEEEELSENYENEEEGNDNKLEVIMEENIFSENFSTNKKPNQEKNKSISSSKYKESNFKKKETYKENPPHNVNEIKKNFHDNNYFKNEEFFQNDIIEGDIKNIIDYKKETKQIEILNMEDKNKNINNKLNNSIIAQKNNNLILGNNSIFYYLLKFKIILYFK